MSRNIQTITKWLPFEINDYEPLFIESKTLVKTSINFIYRLSVLLDHLKSKNYSKLYYVITDSEIELQDIEDIYTTVVELIRGFNNAFYKLNQGKPPQVMSEKIKMWKDLLWKKKLKITYFLQELIVNIAHLFVNYGEKLLVLTLRISTSYNELLSMDSKYEIARSMSVCSNSCPYLMFPLRKISVTKLLQILANNRAELCCHKLIDCLLDTYKNYETNEDDNSSDNSSIEIYKALTKHMSPPDEIIKQNGIAESETQINQNINDSGSFVNVEEMILYEEKNVLDLLNATVTYAPSMVGSDGIKKTTTGETKINPKARAKVLEYYQEILWGEVGNFLEHIILWWAACPLSARSPHSSQHLREWINQFIPSAEISPAILSALTSLADALGVHVNSTSWDQHFRLALVASKTNCNPETGKLFCNVLQDLVMLCNQCEITPDWIIGAPLDELPLVEQIPILHRLDHSVHTTRLWALNETKKIANNWNVEAFFMITQNDIVMCLSQLNNLRLTDHSVEIEKGGLGVHVEVCALMRAKLVSEVKVNSQKLKDSQNECVDCLAHVCRTISLANLQMIFPPPTYWRVNDSTLPQNPSTYVDKYLKQILSPVLAATNDHVVCNMILKLMCESWLDHIYTNKIKFSQHGACQLLIDFGFVETWLTNCPIINSSMRKKMIKNEVLKRCEGVGRLLLRSPGEHIKMIDKNKQNSKPQEGSPNSEKTTELMPAEMYVPNQEQWLELRAVKKRNFINPLCCGKF